MAQVWNIWKAGHKPFQEVGSDIFVLATPQGNLLWTCDPKICSELKRQHDKSQLAVELVKFFEVYGPTVGSVEGHEWKMHRRIITSGFNSATNATVWRNAIKQTGLLIKWWSELGKDWTSRLALHVISAVFFRKRLSWDDGTNDSDAVPLGHRVSFEQALFTVVMRLRVLNVTPRFLLGVLPIERVREAHLAFTEWTKYMQELHDYTMNRLEEIFNTSNKSVPGTRRSFYLER